MNSFCSLGSVILNSSRGLDMNSINYINSFTINITTDFSGAAYSNLSATSGYSDTAAGLNLNNENTTVARLNYQGNVMKTADYENAGTFTFYVKHAARYSSLPTFNFQYPNVIKLSSSLVTSGSSFDTSFYSSLNPGTVIPYTITGCTSLDLTSAPLTGSFTSPYKMVTYTVASGVTGKTVSFNVSGGTVVQISIS